MALTQAISAQRAPFEPDFEPWFLPAFCADKCALF
jgi:hypothetical protein